MQKRWYHHFMPDYEVLVQLEALNQKMNLIQNTLGKIMSTLADVQAAQVVTDQKITAISADVTTLLAKIAAIPPGGLTPEQQAAIDDIAAHAGKINDALSAVDATANPPAAPAA